MPELALTEPLVFTPIFQERIWGGRRLEREYGKRLPPGVRIGESWEIVDREEAQSVVGNGPLRGQTLHQLWTELRSEIFGDVPDSPRFPLLIKLLDAQEKLSLQVHPPPDVAHSLGGEPKTEFWYIAAADPGAELFVGLRQTSERAHFEEALQTGDAADHVHRIAVQAGDSMFLPSGRVHAIGAGNLIVEVQQNSDTTYRVFDWNRVEDGKPRTLHIAESLRSIDFEDKEPQPVKTGAGKLLDHELFHVDKWRLDSPRSAELAGRFAIVCCLSGSVKCGGVTMVPGGFCLVPASLGEVELQQLKPGTEILRITVPR